MNSQLSQRLATLRKHIEQIAEAAEFGFIVHVEHERGRYPGQHPVSVEYYQCGECSSSRSRDRNSVHHTDDCLHGCYQRALDELAAIEQMMPQIALEENPTGGIKDPRARAAMLARYADHWEDQL